MRMSSRATSSFIARATMALGSLAAFASPPMPYPRPLSDEEAMRADWAQVGHDLRGAMEAVREQEKPRQR